MLRTWVLTVFTETDSSLAISGLDRLVGRYRSTLSSLGLSSSVGGDEGWSLAAGEAPCRTSRISASRAACAVSCRGRASSSSPAPVIANGRTSRSGSARARARSRSEEHTSELQSRENLVCRPLLEKQKDIATAFSEYEKRFHEVAHLSDSQMVRAVRTATCTVRAWFFFF